MLVPNLNSTVATLALPPLPALLQHFYENVMNFLWKAHERDFMAPENCKMEISWMYLQSAAFPYIKGT